MTFLNALQQIINSVNNLQTTENGALGFRSTGKKLLDMNYNVPKYRKASAEAIAADFDEACRENELLAVLWMFFARDVRGGLGERRLFRICFSRYCTTNPDRAKAILPLLSEYGRWDDVIYATANTPVWDEAVKLLQRQLRADVAACKRGEGISLLAKWLPSERTSSKQSRELARKLAHDMRMNIVSYNRTLSMLRQHLNVVESKMSAQQWSEIDYAAVPSCANLLYRNAFFKHDEERRKAYLDALRSGHTKINAKTVFPHDIVRQYQKDVGWFATSLRDYDQTLEELWKALPDMGGLDNTIVVADGSGSMTTQIDPRSSTTALDVANGLAIYCAEHCAGEFHNKYITFSMTPQFVDLQRAHTLHNKLRIALAHDECANTNIEAVFDIILDTAIQSHATQNDLPRTILIVSDMEFDNCARVQNSADERYWSLQHPDDTLFHQLKCKYENAGYQLPRLVFWNVNSRTGTIPVCENALGVTLVSGYSLGVMQMIQSGNLDPYANLVATLTSDRYQPIFKALTAS